MRLPSSLKYAQEACSCGMHFPSFDYPAIIAKNNDTIETPTFCISAESII
jgi:hypothetical protein